MHPLKTHQLETANGDPPPQATRAQVHLEYFVGVVSLYEKSLLGFNTK